MNKYQKIFLVDFLNKNMVKIHIRYFICMYSIPNNGSQFELKCNFNFNFEIMRTYKELLILYEKKRKSQQNKI